MSQSTNLSDFDAELDDKMFEQYHDQIFRQFPLPIETHLPETPQISELDIVSMKIRWIIDYLVARVSYKTRIKAMLGPILDLAAHADNRAKIVKSVGSIRIMLKHCDASEIQPVLAEAVYQAVWQVNQ